jgi:hypothetical protein
MHEERQILFANENVLQILFVNEKVSPCQIAFYFVLKLASTCTREFHNDAPVPRAWLHAEPLTHVLHMQSMKAGSQNSLVSRSECVGNECDMTLYPSTVTTVNEGDEEHERFSRLRLHGQSDLKCH